MEDFIGVLVLYKHKLTESVTFVTIGESLKRYGRVLDLLVYDNTPSYNADLSYIKDNRIGNINIIYHPDASNSGVSKAYNLAQNIGVHRNKKWLFLLDQDTHFPLETIEKYLSTIRAFPNAKIFAPIMYVNEKSITSPCKFKYMRGFTISQITPGLNTLKIYSLINCGLCIEINAFNQNNGYNEKIMLDFSDHDFIMRFNHSVGSEFVVIDLKVNHELSTTSQNSFESDLARFNYYLQGAGEIDAHGVERFFLKINSFLRAGKLTFVHRNANFMAKLLKR